MCYVNCNRMRNNAETGVIFLLFIHKKARSCCVNFEDFIVFEYLDCLDSLVAQCIKLLEWKTH